MSSDDLCITDAHVLAARLRAREVSAREVMAAHLDRIHRLNPRLNAIVALLSDEECLALADAADRIAATGTPLPPLHGLPIAIKDLQPAAGFRFTRGSPIFQQAIATEDSVLVERLRAAGALVIGKTNVPEFGMGSHTYNRVYGTTVNPYDLTKSAGGSSGGAACALASGMLPIADGSDLGGSLRNPASFNNVVALRPTPGLVPTAPDPFPLFGLGVNGPMGRTVTDVAFLLAAMAGDDPRDPQSVPSTRREFARELQRDLRGTRIAWCPDLGGLPLDAGVRAVLESQRSTFTALGCRVDDVCPDLARADAIFLTLRRWRTAALYAPLLTPRRDRMKPEALDEVERGLALTAADVARAVMQHAALLDRLARFQQDYDFIVCTVSQVPPFDATLDWPKSIDGVAMDSYVSWMKSAYWISTTLRPSAAVPAGFTADGLPVGMQIVGRQHDDLGVLQMAYAFEQATGFGRVRPAIASVTA